MEYDFVSVQDRDDYHVQHDDLILQCIQYIVKLITENKVKDQVDLIVCLGMACQRRKRSKVGLDLEDVVLLFMLNSYTMNL